MPNFLGVDIGKVRLRPDCNTSRTINRHKMNASHPDIVWVQKDIGLQADVLLSCAVRDGRSIFRVYKQLTRLN